MLYERGFGAMSVFTTAALFGNVVMLNLLIAIVRLCAQQLVQLWRLYNSTPMTVAASPSVLTLETWV